jgi:hypothetical protein
MSSDGPAVSTPAPFDLAVDGQPDGPGRYRASLDRSWWVDVGPNGGYLAAVLTQAARLETARLGNDHRPASISAHYLRAPRAGAATVQTRVIRTGRTTTVLGLDLSQPSAGVLMTALLTLVAPAGGDALAAAPATVRKRPAVPAAGETPVRSLYEGASPTYLDHWEIRPVRGHLPFAAPTRDVTEPIDCAGWIRLREDRPVDAGVLVAMADAWAPLVFGVIAEPMLVPTLSFNLLWRATPGADARWCLISLRTEASAGGLVDERVELRAEDGELLLQGQQLAQLRPNDRRAGTLTGPDVHRSDSTRSS